MTAYRPTSTNIHNYGVLPIGTLGSAWSPIRSLIQTGKIFPEDLLMITSDLIYKYARKSLCLAGGALRRKGDSRAPTSLRSPTSKPNKLPLAPCPKKNVRFACLSKLRQTNRPLFFAESEGFEPPVRRNAYTAFRVRHFRPLSQLSSPLKGKRVQKYCFFLTYANFLRFFFEKNAL